MPGFPGVILAAAITAAGLLSGETSAQVPERTENRAPTASPVLAELLRLADRDGLHQDPQWLALLHYERQGILRRERGRAITPSFFLSGRGDLDPRAELHATLRSFFDPTAIVRDGEHPQCAFVARRQWLARRLGPPADDLPRVACPLYERWRRGLDARGLTLIFPEGFMDNPASMFGHTLLRVDSNRDSGSGEMLGYAVDFTANAGTDSGFVYVAKGVLGFYPGFFGIHPYYQQLKRYSDWENRDIWEYRLDVSQTELDFLLMHLWELRGVEFPYYFFTKNCSYELLRLLEIGVADVDASARFPGPVIPVETVRVLVEQPGLVTATRFRPSPETELRASLRSLTRADRDRVQAIVTGELDPTDETHEQIPARRRARILEVAYDQLRYEYLAGYVSEGDSRHLSRRILIARSRVEKLEPGADLAPVEVQPPPVRPDQGHEGSLFSLSAGWRDNEALIDVRFRPAFHGLMDDAGGYPEHMQIRFLDTRLRIFPETGRVRLQELTLIDVASLSPRSRVFRRWAWSFRTGLQTRRVPDRHGLDDASVWGTNGGAGIAVEPRLGVLLYGLADLRLDVGPDLENDVSFGPGARLGMFVGKAGMRWTGHLFGQATRFVAGDTANWFRGGVEARLSTSRNTAIVLEGSANRTYGEGWLEGVVRLNLYL